VTAIERKTKAISISKAGKELKTRFPRKCELERTLATMPDAETVIRRMTQAIPVQRLGTAEDIAKVALFLASSDADYVSSTSLVVDGGLLSKLPLPEYW
jgi:NAD(P)-dependent dehydrogenase (short-subunit alcohol dehydrogenase family)